MRSVLAAYTTTSDHLPVAQITSLGATASFENADKIRHILNAQTKIKFVTMLN